MRVAALRTSDRLSGIDIARGVAILGAIALWFLPKEAEGQSFVLQHVLDGRVLGLFALIVGISIGLLSGGSTPLRGPEAAQARVRILVRAAAVYAIGHFVGIAGLPIDNTLSAFAFVMVLTIPFLHLSRRTLWIIAGAWLVALPFLGVLWSWLAGYTQFNGSAQLGFYVALGDLPLLRALPIALVGLGIARCDLSNLRLQGAVTGAGAAILAAGIIVAAVGGDSVRSISSGADDRAVAVIEGDFAPFSPDGEDFLSKSGPSDDSMIDGKSSSKVVEGDPLLEMPEGIVIEDLSGKYCVRMMGSFYQCFADEASADEMATMMRTGLGMESPDDIEEQSFPPVPSYADQWKTADGWDGYRDIVGETAIVLGAAMLVVGAALLVSRWLQPVAALGTMPITAYVSLALVARFATPPLGGWDVAIVALAATAVAFLWHRLIGRGPIESLVHAISVRAAHIGETVPGPAGDRDRIVGLDIARGLAVIGMVGAHMISPLPFLGWSPDTWSGIASGRPSILFAVLAGISMAIMSGRNQPYTGEKLFQARSRILTRAFVIFGLGILLTEFVHGIAVILDYYGIFFILALPFLTWRPRNLFITAAALAVAAPFVNYYLGQWDALNSNDPLFSYLIGGVYPAFGWLALMLFGLGLGRLRLGDIRIQKRLLLVGLVLTVTAYGLGEWAEHVTGNQESQARIQAMMNDAVGSSDMQIEVMPGEDVDTDSLTCTQFETDLIVCEKAIFGGEMFGGDMSVWTMQGTWGPHTGSSFELFGSGGFAAMLIALCLMATRKVAMVLYPLAAVGTAALTVYVAHVIMLALWTDTPTGQYTLFLTFLAVVIPIATLWKKFLGRGPLERVLSWLAYKNSQVAE